jgi:hypothetical protein
VRPNQLGSVPDVIPAADAAASILAQDWLDEWEDAFAAGDSPRMLTHLRVLGIAFDSIGLKSTFRATQMGVAASVKQRPWKWFREVVCFAARAGNNLLVARTFVFLRTFAILTAPEINKYDPDVFIAIGLDSPSVDSVLIVAQAAEQALSALARIGTPPLRWADTTLPVLEWYTVACQMHLTARDYLHSSDAEPAYTLGRPLSANAWTDARTEDAGRTSQPGSNAPATWWPTIGHPAGTGLRPWFIMRGGGVFATLDHPNATDTVNPWFQVRDGRWVYSTMWYPDGDLILPIFEIRGRSVFTTSNHPHPNLHYPWYEIR